MAIKYTEEQLNTVDKSIIIQMFLNQQEEFFPKYERCLNILQFHYYQNSC